MFWGPEPSINITVVGVVLGPLSQHPLERRPRASGVSQVWGWHEGPGGCWELFPGVSLLSSIVLDSQQLLGLDLFPFFLHRGQAADNCRDCGPCAAPLSAPLAARGFSLLQVEDSSGRKESRLRGPL